MHTKRIIPCLDVKDGRVVKGTNFVSLRDAGDPVELAAFYDRELADELVFLDITASSDGRNTMVDVVRRTASQVFIPFTVGGGIRSVDDIRTMLHAGADKVSLNTAAVKAPALIAEGAKSFGSQCIVLAVDGRMRSDHSGWNVVINGGRIDTGMDALEWVAEGVRLGAGEILLTSMDADGTKQGFDISFCKAVKQIVQVPVIASGGCGSLEHFNAVFQENAADAALAASLFHYGELTAGQVKEYLNERGVPVRL